MGADFIDMKKWSKGLEWNHGSFLISYISCYLITCIFSKIRAYYNNPLYLCIWYMYICTLNDPGFHSPDHCTSSNLKASARHSTARIAKSCSRLYHVCLIEKKKGEPWGEKTRTMPHCDVWIFSMPFGFPLFFFTSHSQASEKKNPAQRKSFFAWKVFLVVAKSFIGIEENSRIALDGGKDLGRWNLTAASFHLKIGCLTPKRKRVFRIPKKSICRIGKTRWFLFQGISVCV